MTLLKEFKLKIGTSKKQFDWEKDPNRILKKDSGEHVFLTFRPPPTSIFKAFLSWIGVSNDDEKREKAASEAFFRVLFHSNKNIRDGPAFLDLLAKTTALATIDHKKNDFHKDSVKSQLDELISELKHDDQGSKFELSLTQQF